MKIRNWSSHQHYKDRAPPWIKLHRELLNDREWFALTGEQSRLLVNLWLLAAEDESGEGLLPEIPDIAFRLRMTDKKVSELIQGLTHFVDGLASTSLAPCKQTASSALATCTPETETEVETEVEGECAPAAPESAFSLWYEKYPRKRERKKAERAFTRLSRKDQQAAYCALSSWPFDADPQYIPYPASWLNGRRWEDEPDPPSKTVKGTPEPVAAVNAMPVHRARPVSPEERERQKAVAKAQLAKLREKVGMG